MKKKLLIRCGVGFLLGVAMMLLIPALFNRGPDGTVNYCSDELLARVGGSPAAAMAVSLLLYGLYGACCMGGTLLYEIERWPLALATAVHYLIIALGYALAAHLRQTGFVHYETSAFARDGGYINQQLTFTVKGIAAAQREVSGGGTVETNRIHCGVHSNLVIGQHAVIEPECVVCPEKAHVIPAQLAADAAVAIVTQSFNRDLVRGARRPVLPDNLPRGRNGHGRGCPLARADGYWGDPVVIASR